MGHFQTIYGEISTPETPDDLIVRSLKLYGEWSLTEQHLLAPLIRAEDRFWDVGAFLGTFGLGLTRMAKAPPSFLLSVEPNPEILPHLQDNLRRNAPCKFEVAACAAGGENQYLSRRPGAGDGNAGAISYQPASTPENAVHCRTLEDLRSQYGDYDVLKLDVEGMENAAIRGDIEFIKQNRPVIWAECNEIPESVVLLETLVWLGYEPLYVGFPAFRSKNFNRSTQKIFPLAYEAGLLAAPKERLDQFTGQAEAEDIIIRPVKTSFDLRRALWVTPRWSMPEWTTLSRAELIATLGRMESHQTLETFLNV